MLTEGNVSFLGVFRITSVLATREPLPFGICVTISIRFKRLVFHAQRIKEHTRFVFYFQGFACCSDTAIGFHKVGASDMYVYDYLIYRMNPYGFNNKRSEIQLHPDPPPDAELTVENDKIGS